MNQIFAIAVAVSFFGFLANAHGQDPEKQPEDKPTAKGKPAAEETIELPESETSAVFTMKYLGGFRRSTPKDWVNKPYLQVFADGRVVNGAGSPEGDDYEFKLKQEQLQRFLKQVINKNNFYKINSDTIKEEIAEAGQAARIADATTLEITMELPRGDNTTSVYSLRSTAKQFPKIESLQQLARIEDLGRNLALVANAGGYEEVERAMSKVNEKLKEKGLDLMTINELYTCKRENEVLTINFNRKYYEENGMWRHWVNAKFIIDGDEEKVEVKTNIEKGQKKIEPGKKATSTKKEKRPSP